VCIVTTIAVSSPPSLKSSSMGVLGATGALASVIGAPFGSKIGDQFGWRHGIIAFGAMAILGGLIFWFFYRRGRNANVPIEGRTYGNSRTTAQPPMPETRSAFRTPIVWALALLLGLCGVGQFSMTFFVPSAASTIFKLGAVDAAYIISTGYIAAIFANLLFGYLMDRFNKWKIMSALMTAFILSCLAMTPENLNLFRTATALMLALGFSATNQVYAIAGQVLSGRETGNVMGVVSLGAGIFGYVGPQMLGVLRDWTGGFTAGWLAMAGLAALALIEIIVLSGYGGEKRRLWKKGEAGAQP
jgi:NNP family nitrate/nitrite transporter-like MFS transporter